MAETRQAASHENPPQLNAPTTVPFDRDKEGRNFGILLGVVMSVYMIAVNAIYAELPMGVRFAKHLLIIPIVWIATKRYADAIAQNGEIFKAEIGLLFRIGMWATAVIALLNLVLSAIQPAWAFEQFMNDSETFGDVMMNSFFVGVETLVFVIIIGFVFMQGLKRGGAPED